MKQIVLSFLLLLALAGCRTNTAQKTWTLLSPDGRIRMDIFLAPVPGDTTAGSGNILQYRVQADGRQVIAASRLGLFLRGGDGNLAGDLQWTASDSARIDETYELPSGKKRIYTNRGNELTLTFHNRYRRAISVILRAYNDGAAFRYRLPGQDSGTIVREASGFTIPAQSRAWAQPVGGDDCHETEFVTGLSGPGLLGGQDIWYPLLYNTPDSSHWVLLTEAAVYGSYCGSHLCYSGGTYQVALHDTSVSSSRPWETPWRVAIIGSTPAPVIESSLVENLNPPTEAKDISWIRPGRSSWTWWYAGEPNGAPGKIDPDEWKRFAREMGWEYGCSEHEMWWDWSGHWEGRQSQWEKFLQQGPLGEVLDADLARCSRQGILIHKCDFMDSDSQERMQDYDAIAAACMKNHLLLNWHGARLPGGERRRWPNMIGYEGIRGAEYYKWSGGPGLFHRLTIPFTRNVVGPMDFTGVTFGFPADGKRNNTDAAELAIAMLYENGIQYWGAPPREYRKRPAAMSFLKKCPAAWEQTRYMDGYPGSYICLARQQRNSSTWFIGAMVNNAVAQKKSISFSFLPPGNRYELELHRDGKNAGEIITEKRIVSSDTTLSVALLPNGGYCGVLEQLK